MNRQELATNFVDYVEEERVRMNLTQAEMAQKLELSISGYKKMISGETTRIDLYTAKLLHDTTRSWMFEWVKDEIKEANLLRKLKHLSKNQIQLLEAIADIETMKNVSEKQNIITVFIPTSDMKDGMIYDASNIESLSIPEKYYHHVDCGIRITSNHLHPVYHMGDTILVKCEPPRDGDIGIFIHKPTGKVYIRKFRQLSPCQLIPVNGYGTVIMVDSKNEDDMNQWIKFGHIIATLKG